MRLTNAIRERILSAAIKKSGLIDEEKKVSELYASFAENCRKKVVTKEVEEIIREIKSLRKQIKSDVVDVHINERSHLYVNCGGQRRCFSFDGTPDRAIYSDNYTRLSPYEMTLKHGDILLKDLDKADKLRASVKSKRKELDSALRSTLWSVTTDKKLYEVWPESKAFMPIVEGAPTVNFPALPIKDLNKMIGL